MRLHWVFLILVSIMAVTLTACGTETSGGINSMDSNGETAVLPQQIICHLAYRPNTSSSITQEDMIIIKNENTDLQQTIGDFIFHIMYLDGSMGGERSLRLSATPQNNTNELTAQLYQFPLNSGPSNQFVGGHGFTGLTYVTDPTSNAELQFWCTAE